MPGKSTGSPGTGVLSIDSVLQILGSKPVKERRGDAREIMTAGKGYSHCTEGLDKVEDLLSGSIHIGEPNTVMISEWDHF